MTIDWQSTGVNSVKGRMETPPYGVIDMAVEKNEATGRWDMRLLASELPSETEALKVAVKLQAACRKSFGRGGKDES